MIAPVFFTSCENVIVVPAAANPALLGSTATPPTTTVSCAVAGAGASCWVSTIAVFRMTVPPATPAFTLAW